MARVAEAVRGALRRARVALKRFAYSGPGRDRWQQPDRVVAGLGLRPGDKVAELGAGGGYFTVRLAEAVAPGGVVYAVDTDPDMLAGLTRLVARSGAANVVPVAARPADPRLPERVDLAVLVNAYHHLPDRPAYFATLAGYLEPGARVAVVEVRPSGARRLLGHATAPETIRSELAAAGYATVADLDFLPRQSFLVVERRDEPRND